LKLSVCNIAWDAGEHDDVVELLRRRGVRGVEVAPTKLWPDWAGAGPSAAADWRDRLAAVGFEVPALQAILFGRPDLQVFAAESVREATLAQIGRVAELAAVFGARMLVFGSPLNRKRGDLSPSEARASAIDFFRECGRLCACHDVSLCLEPLPEVYGNNFITCWRDAVELVRAVDTPGFGLLLDTGCIHVAGDDPAEAVMACAGILQHFHVSEPHLVGLGKPAVHHRQVGKALAQSGYRGWISIEMRRGEHPLEQIGEAVDRVRDWYGGL
jgi:sugar phosphate isomerase/epimerase